ncbi:lactate utilization protein [Telmatospirillum sp. J64-1]|uniref:LutC/YkgG family protein n=1 Tax=Telmatospirillum sp. J64-1 TaxID=2502183 RepID=UPI00115E1AFF|nr:lactate utilization protein [Telmatospirillum sp. J64-1]
MPDARDSILSRLRAAPRGPAPGSDFSVMEDRFFPPEERLARLRKMMEAVSAEFFETTKADWPRFLHGLLVQQGIGSILYGPGSEAGQRLAEEWPEGGARAVAYDRPMDSFKEEMFNGVEAGLTSTLGGIAETGSLILWPSADEPRALSLVPPVHVALLDPDKLHNTFWQAMRALGWSQTQMPANALLVSGPSKTTDIEQTLAYGVHGPKRLIVLITR